MVIKKKDAKKKEKVDFANHLIGLYVDKQEEKL